jgi:hypothetical protein
LSREFRESEFIDFRTGIVKVAPLQLQFKQSLGGTPAFADLVRLFQCRMEVWHLGVAVQIAQSIEFGHPPSVWSHAAYGLMTLLFAYFETVGRILNEKPNPAGMDAADFDCGFRDLYAKVTSSAGVEFDPTEFYQRARNGLIPLGSTQQGILVHNERTISTQDFDIIQKNPHDLASQKYYVNPHSVLRTVVNHFPTLIARLNNADARHNDLRARFRAFMGDRDVE